MIRLAKDAHPVIQPAAAGAAVAVNGIRLGQDPTPLLHGDRIEIGDQEIRVSDPDAGGATRVFAPPAQAVREVAASEPAVKRSGPAGRLVSLTDGREYSLATVPFVLGRDAQAQVVIASPDASRRHAEIATVPDGDVLVDLSANGTYVNGARIGGRQRLKALDVIRIGAEEFRYYPPPPPPPPTLPPSRSGPPTGAEFRLGDTLIGIPSGPRPAAVARPAAVKPLAVLLVRKGPAKGERLPVMRPSVTIGRADYNDVRLTDPSVSASHGKLELREGIWILTDLGSTNGTAVDGARVTEETPLSPGTVITIGEIDLVFEPHDEGISREAATRVLPKSIPSAAAADLPPAGEPAPAPASGRSEAGAPPSVRSRPAVRRSNTVFLVLGVIVVLALLAALAFLF